MSDAHELQRMIATAWNAGYNARETELVCRRRSNDAERQREISRLVQKILTSTTDDGRRTADDGRQMAVGS
jgi:hypothetical protein